ncbi:hypothetical protein ACU686_42785 [Yinghuangia aomiensis]
MTAVFVGILVLHILLVLLEANPGNSLVEHLSNWAGDISGWSKDLFTPDELQGPHLRERRPRGRGVRPRRRRTLPCLDPPLTVRDCTPSRPRRPPRGRPGAFGRMPECAPTTTKHTAAVRRRCGRGRRGRGLPGAARGVGHRLACRGESGDRPAGSR